MENNNNNLPSIPENNLMEKLKKFFNKIIDVLFTNHSEGIVIAEFDENGKLIENEEGKESDFEESVIKEETVIDESEIELDEKSSFEETLKVDLTTYQEEKDLNDKRIEFIGALEENPASLIDLSLDRLKKIEEYYDELIADLDDKIENAKKVS